MNLEFLDFLFFTISVLVFISFCWFGYISIREKEQRATRMALRFAVIGGGLFLGIALSPYWLQMIFLWGGGILVLIGIALFYWPVGKVIRLRDKPEKRFDERDIMFARARLMPDNPNFDSYYKMRPENKDRDDLTRAQPGLLSADAKYSDQLLFSAPKGSFTLTEGLWDSIDGKLSENRITLEPEKMSDFVKQLSQYYGALDVGITELKPYHVYSHIGRGSGEYGAPIPIEHSYAIAFTVEMDFEMIGANPTAPGVMESAKQYVESARVAVPLAAAIRSMGYPARAHIDGNYRVIAPLVARDAGLGEIGRMGLVMTPNEGPRVRLGVVTTNLPLQPDERELRPDMIDFCTICKKCAENCPVKAIPYDDRKEVDGAIRWQINADTCFRYWNVIGTDCGRCMTVCPYSHPNTLAHNLVRAGAQQSGNFRRLALTLDDLFYGRNPIQREPPAWTQIHK